MSEKQNRGIHAYFHLFSVKFEPSLVVLSNNRKSSLLIWYQLILASVQLQSEPVLDVNVTNIANYYYEYDDE